MVWRPARQGAQPAGQKPTGHPGLVSRAALGPRHGRPADWDRRGPQGTPGPQRARDEYQPDQPAADLPRLGKKPQPKGRASQGLEKTQDRTQAKKMKGPGIETQAQGPSQQRLGSQLFFP